MSADPGYHDGSSSSSGVTPGAGDLPESVVSSFSRNRSSCGYCKSAGRSSITHGMWAQNLTVLDYQDLLDRGWRRSGCYVYRPIMKKTCCPSYAIRLKAEDFVPSKSQIRVKRKLQRYLDGTLDVDDDDGDNDDEQDEQSIPSTSRSKHQERRREEDPTIRDITEKLDDSVREWTRTSGFPNDLELPKASVKKVHRSKRTLFAGPSEMMVYTSSTPFQLSAALRKSPELAGHTRERIAETLADSLIRSGEIPALAIRARGGHVNFYAPRNDSDEERKATVVVAAAEAAARPRQFLRKAEITLSRSSFDPEEYELYRKYQIAVHGDDPNGVSEDAYRNFLVNSPLIYVPYSGDSAVPRSGFGSFHQQYRIDGKLIAVGVIDVLPRCLSSKYLFWDPEFSRLSPGKIAAVQEIEWVKVADCPTLRYYYLGYYIHSCPKMKYKAAYRPSQLLCPLRYTWVSFDIARLTLDIERYVVLSDFLESHDGETSRGSDPNNGDDDDADGDPQEKSLLVQNVSVILRKRQSKFKDVLKFEFPSMRHKGLMEAHLYLYAKVLGVSLSRRIVYSFD